MEGVNAEVGGDTSQDTEEEGPVSAIVTEEWTRVEEKLKMMPYALRKCLEMMPDIEKQPEGGGGGGGGGCH